MTNHFFFYLDAPIGPLEIRANDQFVTALYFEGGKGASPIRQPSSPDLPPHLQTAIEELNAYFSGRLRTFSFPMQQTGTNFQLRVWQELMHIPYGETLSYLELSQRIGDTKAIRAVGTANGRNNLSIVVPCHRVIGKNGQLTGYGGGIWRKDWLLNHEAKWAKGVLTLF
ncbi:MAG: methylated-DNA--[protein]-cysteine S-methyltransferase [Bacteroidetes Order II. Incertae sedis bacterium]|nr:methylated-DNA--[protein]-cysteine S-methyltransferase [Bacteroidetes Order II. bacterium]